MPMTLRPAAALAAAGILLIGAGLAGCAGGPPLPADPAGRLFARGLDDIAEFYISPVSSRLVALAGAARLSGLDDKFAVVESPGQEGGTEIVLSYGEREVADYPSPPDDPHSWGAWLGRLIADAKTSSRAVAALADDRIDEAVFDGMMSALDRFSRYASPEAARDQRAARDGFGGIGVTLDVSSGELRIASVSPGGPAAVAGLRPGDRIVAIDRQATAGRSEDDVVDQLRGPVLSPVEVAIDRPGLAGSRSFRLRRALIILPTVTLSRDDDIAVLRVTSFNQDTTQQIVEDLGRLQRETRLSGIVLDLRGNPGGLLDQAVSLSDVFIAKGPIVSTVGRHPASHQFFEASGDSLAPQIPIVVLIDGGSASASEIVAAALQDDGRAVVIGSASYGKGTVQTVLRLPNDGELTLTWARLVTPSGYFLNQHGVVPNVCTSDLGNDERSIRIALQRAGAPSLASPLISRPRASLDDNDWSRLRRSCPARRGNHPIDLTVAERLLVDPVLYGEAVHVIATAQSPAAGAVAAVPAAAGLP